MADREIQPNGVYGKADLAEHYGVSVKTIERWSLISVRQMQDGTPAKLPPPFYIGRLPRWRGAAIIAHEERLQAESIRMVTNHG